MGNRERDEKIKREKREEKSKDNAFAEIENKTGEGSRRRRPEN